MRPEQLRIRGLASFREETVVDFADLNLFAIVGPTGSGKSSLIDALCFALYGTVPRLGGNTIAPLISSGAKEMAVALTFSIRHNQYRVTRRVRRTSKEKASTDEASLEQLSPASQILAGTASDVTAGVEELLGLNFKEFTKAVVLPQGEFASLLKATAAERQELLSKLLGIDFYESFRTQAGEEAKEAQRTADQMKANIAKIGEIGAKDIEAAKARVATLERISGEVDGLHLELEETRTQYSLLKQQVGAAKGVVDALDAIGAPPPALVRHGEEVQALDAALTASSKAYQEAQDQLATLSQVPDLTEAQRVIHGHAQVEELTQAHQAACSDAQAWVAHITGYQAKIEPAQRQQEQAKARVEEAMRRNAAAQAATGLVVGDSCPVCANEIGPNAPALGMEANREFVREQQVRLDQATREVERLHLNVVRAKTQQEGDQRKADEVKDRLNALQASLAGTLSLPQAKQLVLDAQAARERWQSAKDEVATWKTRVARDQAAKERAVEAVAVYVKQLDDRRLALGQLQPPAVNPEDIAQSWQALYGWAQQQRPHHEAAYREAEQAFQGIWERGNGLRQRLDSLLEEAGVAGQSGQPIALLARAKAQGEHEVERLTTVLAEVNEWEAQRAQAQEQSDIYKELAKHLKAGAFPAWLLHETTQALIRGASTHLLSLSNGQFQLELQEKHLVVIDRANANLERSVRTLSGGETFLASLALALALADYIHHLAASPITIACLFIDEGFGALDAESLNLAAQALEQLGSSEKMVGVITHVPELAERLPARIRVQRQGITSQVVSEL